MKSDPGPGEKSGITRNKDTSDKDLIAELEIRVAFLENELRLKHDQTVLDIAERDQAIEKLAEKERFLRNIFECIKDGISVLDKDLNILQVNPAMEKWYGHVTGKKCYQAYHGRSEPCEPCPSIRAIKTGSTQSGVVHDLKGWREIYAFPLVNDRGEVTGVIEHVRDIDERKQAQEALRESEEKYRRVVEAANEGIWIIDRDMRTTFVNDRMSSMLGYTMEEMAGKKIEDFTSDSYLDVLNSDMEMHRRGVKVRHDFQFRRKDGSDLWCMVSATPILDDKGVFAGGVAMITDVTERKRAEEAVRFANAYNRSLIEASIDPLVTISPDGKITDVNMATEVATGISRDDLIGTDFSNYFTDPDMARKGYKKVFEEGSVKDYPLEIRHRDGHITHVLYNASIYRDESGIVIGVFATARDISERKRAEEALVEAKAQAELYLDLLGHDINNMHQIALGYLELARDVSPVAGKSEFLDKPIEVLQRGAQLIQNVRKLRKLKEGVFQTQEVDVCGVLSDVRREFGAVPNKAITLNTNGRERCIIRANELLHDVFANLVSNAIKHTGDRADIAIDLDVLEDHDREYCRVMVEDNGPGIPDDFKDRIFNRMLRGTTKAKGMGLGLYLVKSLVESYGGRVWVEDRVSGDHTKGARFVVMLPTV
ncbi:putative histidine kinase [Methanocella paludicola SANAE]|uniref:histidine kinase n=1 Tax=Methanocella paludicola (strain DSM 17711 / JCM 13418 / NBRC 101707 / SANAE) TaxID=304371 RepID=D1YYU7_METPS|nr:PAS domain-containing sensor histidine kinase [Methanocella paludicola]BAI61619.1 putative histidine kinase [Methanocella paludicola SANAE]